MNNKKERRTLEVTSLFAFVIKQGYEEKCYTLSMES